MYKRQILPLLYRRESWRLHVSWHHHIHFIVTGQTTPRTCLLYTSCALCHHTVNYACPHTANYKGCYVYQNLELEKVPYLRIHLGEFVQFWGQWTLNRTWIPLTSLFQIVALYSKSSPPDDSSPKQTANEGIKLSHFQTKFETMFSQLMQQNSVMQHSSINFLINSE